MRTAALVLFACVAGCGGDDDDGGEVGPAIDAAVTSADGAPADGGAAASCADYCATIAEACVDALRQYHDLEICLATCALFPPGTAGDDGGDSLACRAHHAELAREAPDPHCYHAGPSGDGVCGEPCEGYCDIVMPPCGALYADRGECAEVCAAFPDPRPYTVRESRSDTVACRIFHATRATVDDGHCGTASADSVTCVD